MRILVTGGAGFIGSHIIEHAIAAGHEVAALDDLSSGKRENLPAGVKLYEVDVRDAGKTKAAVSDFKPNAISHQAAQASVSVSMRDPNLDASVNVIGGLNVANAARDLGVKRVVFASTGGAIYGNIESGAAKEDWAADPISPYAIHKFAFEKLLNVYEGSGAFSSSILRYANVFGPRQDPHGEAGVVAIFYRRVLENQPISVNGMRVAGDDGCIRDYVYVSDVAKANLAALTGSLRAKLMNIGTGIPTDTRQLAQTIVSSVEKTSSTVNDTPPRVGDVERSVLDGSLFRTELGPFVPLAEGLAKTADWFAKEPSKS